MNLILTTRRSFSLLIAVITGVLVTNLKCLGEDYLTEVSGIKGLPLHTSNRDDLEPLRGEKAYVSFGRDNDILSLRGSDVISHLGTPSSTLVRGKNRVLVYASPKVEKMRRTGTPVKQKDGAGHNEGDTHTGFETVRKNIPKSSLKIPYFFDITVDANDKVIGVRDLLLP